LPENSITRISAGDPLHTPATVPLQPAGFEVEALVGSTVDGFRIVSMLGEGGSAVVFRAEREVGGATQTVALKLLRTGLFSSEAQRRFQREQNILTQLSHPNIAHLIDAGISVAGIPYIAVELVDGLTLTEYASRHRLVLAARLRLLADLARAVDAAHRALVVHRDLKPSNVLVNSAGQVKVLDFGIAKLLGDEIDTATQHIALTPAYAAPEQFHSGAVTTAVDVYALGVVAAELLLGARLGVDATLPRDTLEVDALRRGWRQLDHDLATILRTALASEPVARYASAQHFADDIEHFLHNEPIAARAPSALYRARKFVARHSLLVAVSGAFLISLFAALGLAVWQAGIAKEEARRANSVSRFVEGLFAPLRDGVAAGKQPSLTELVAQGVARIDQTPELGAAARVDLLLLFARVNDYLNERDRMQALTTRASALADAELGIEHPLAIEALVSRALAGLRQSNYDQVGPLFAQAEQRMRASGVRGESWIRAHDGMSQMANDLGKPAQAVEYARISLAERIEIAGPDSDEAMGGHANVAFALEGIGDFTEAAKAYARVYQSRVALLGADNGRSAGTLGSLGAAELMAGELLKAQHDLRAAMQVFDGLGGKPRAGHVAVAQQACTVETVLGSRMAQAACAHAVELARASEDPPGNSVARALRVQGVQMLQNGDLEAAKLALDESAAMFTADAPANWRGRTDIAAGELALLRGDNGEASERLSRGIERLGAGYPPYLPRYGSALLALACAGVQTPHCLTHASAQAVSALDSDPYGWNALLLPAHIAVARIDLVAGDAKAATARLREAIREAQTQGLADDQRYLLSAQLWLAVSSVDSANCGVSRALARPVLGLIRDRQLTTDAGLREPISALQVSSCPAELAR